MKREGDRVRNQCQSYIMVVKVVFLAPGVAFNRTAIILGMYVVHSMSGH